MTKLKFGRYIVETSSEDKIYFPPDITKGDLVNYYKEISPMMVPYLKNRCLMMHRFPDGINGESFYQKNASEYFPDWIEQKNVPIKGGGQTNFVVCQNAATLVYIANQACITPHIWLSRIDKIQYPDKLIFDLDPYHKSHDFKPVVEAALLIKELLEHFKLKVYIMTTGSHGMHVVVPLDRSLDFKKVRTFAQDCAKFLINLYPDKLTLEVRKNKRGKRIFIDTLRNQFGATAVAPYAVRAHPGAPVATPLYWEELKDKDLTSQKYTIFTVSKKLKKLKDPWKDFNKSSKSLKKYLDYFKAHNL